MDAVGKYRWALCALTASCLVGWLPAEAEARAPAPPVTAAHDRCGYAPVYTFHVPIFLAAYTNSQALPVEPAIQAHGTDSADPASPQSSPAGGIRATWDRFRAWSTETFDKIKSSARQAHPAEDSSAARSAENRAEAQQIAAPQRQPVAADEEAPVAERLLGRDTPAPWREGVSVGRVPVTASPRPAEASANSLQRLPPVAAETPAAEELTQSAPTDARLERLPPTTPDRIAETTAEEAGEPTESADTAPSAKTPETEVADLSVDAIPEESVHELSAPTDSTGDARAEMAQATPEPSTGLPPLDASGTGGLIVVTPALVAQTRLRPTVALLAAPEFPATGLSVLRPAVESKPTIFEPLQPPALTGARDPAAVSPGHARMDLVELREAACRPYVRPLLRELKRAGNVCRLDAGPCWPGEWIVSVPGEQPARRAAHGLALLDMPGAKPAGLRVFAGAASSENTADARQSAVRTASHQTEAGTTETAVQWAVGDDELGVIPKPLAEQAGTSRLIPPPPKAWSGHLMQSWVASVPPAPRVEAVVCHRRVNPIDLGPIGAILAIEDADELNVLPRQNRLLRTSVEVIRVAVDDPAVCEVIQLSSNEISLVGRGPGTTCATFWFRGDEHPVTYVMQVPAEPTSGQPSADEFHVP